MTTITELRTQAATCTRCDLYQHAIQTVFGDGPAHTPLMLVGEQPGDQEDKQGRAFVGPAGHVFDRALEQAGIRRGDAYLTNAVKHFRHTERGKRRIHQRPDTGQIRACRPWLDDELAVVRPKLVVLLGAVAGESFFGPRFRVGASRGVLTPAEAGSWTGQTLGTIHPSAVLRGQDQQSRDNLFDGLVADLRAAREAAGL